MRDRLATIDMGRKLEEGCALLTAAGSPSNAMWPPYLLPPYQVASRSIQPFGYNRHGPKSGRRAVVAPFLGRGNWVPI